ncbi:unnamed protein product [Paramecium primaurelia]|uniref:Uncharacterized protein n=1 Tax=Paramecium primaurelia TaxID=5886 RepID=A0A8S1Q221_PARPR|nr:unnamed protein product [Paramecium primaurelia]
MNQNKLPMFKFTVVGYVNVGKTSFIQQYSESKFQDQKDLTIGLQLITKIVVVDKTKVKLQIWDTVSSSLIIQAGQEKYGDLLKLNYREAAAVFVLYDVTQKISFEKLHEKIKELEEHAPENIIKILVGNKSDEPDEKRQVSQQEAKKFSTDYGFDHYFETSAKSGENVEQVFVEAVRSVIVRMYMNQSFKSSIITIDNNIGDSRFGSGTPINNPPQIQERIRLKSIPQQQYAIPQQQQEKNYKGCC